MASYIKRRKAWFKLIKSMDDSISLSDELLGDLLLDNSGITQLERQMILTVTGNTTPFV